MLSEGSARHLHLFVQEKEEADLPKRSGFGMFPSRYVLA